MALFSSGRGNYEVQVFQDGRWITNAIRNWEGEALELAEKLLSSAKCAGARVVLEDDYDGEEILFEKKQAIEKDKPIRITTIEGAVPYCKSSRDFFSLESRMIMNRMFREYLENVFLTPTEVLHDYRELQRLCDKDNLLSSAVDNIARLQTKDSEAKPRQRREEIHAFVDQIMEQARQTENQKMPAIKGKFSGVVAYMAKAGGDKSDYMTMVVLTRELVKKRNWLDKLQRLCELAAQEKPNSKAILLLDAVIADVLGANIIQELLGWQRSLGSAIIGMLDLAEGKFEPSDSEAPEIVEALSSLFRENALPASQNVLIDRAIHQLKSPQPLYRAEPEKEMEEYRRVLLRLLVPGGILSGARAAEAITLRGARFVEQGGQSGTRAAIGATVKVMPDRARGVMYLAELSNTDLAENHLNDIVQELDNVFGARVIEELCRRSMSPKDRMVAATGAFNATVSSALPDELKDRVTQHIDGVLERYLVDENIIEKLDDPGAHIRDRAVRLVKFCGAGVLPEGKAMTLARKRIIKLLRHPNFDERFVEGIAKPDIAERALRDFHKLLVKAGLA